MEAGIIFDVQSPALFGVTSVEFLAFLNSKSCQFLLDLEPGPVIRAEHVAALPFVGSL